MAMSKLPFTIIYTDGDKYLTLTLDKERLSGEETGALVDHLSYFLREMDEGPTLYLEGEETIGEMMMAQYDDDPNPYHGDYSEE